MRTALQHQSLYAIKDACTGLLDDHSVIISLSYSYIGVGDGFSAMMPQSTSDQRSSLPEKVRSIIDTVTHGGRTFRRNSSSLAIGYSCSGMVIAVGSKVSSVRVGDLVACGSTGHSAHGQVLAVPEGMVIKLNREEQLKSGSLVALGAMALYNVRRASIALGETVVVFGMGTLGQLIVQLAAHAGARVIAVDDDMDRLKLAKQSGAQEIIHTGEGSFASRIDLMSNGYGADVALITPDALSWPTFQQSVESVRTGGRVVVVGTNILPGDDTRVEAKEIEIRFSSLREARNRVTEVANMKLFVSLLDQGTFKVDHLLATSWIALTSGSRPTPSSNGTVVQYAGEPLRTKHEKSPEKRYVPAKKPGLSVGFYGLSSFMVDEIMPIIDDIRRVHIDRIVDSDIRASALVADRYHSATFSTGDARVLCDEETDVLFMANTATRPVSFSDVKIALEHNKAVMLNQPIFMNPEESEELHTLVRAGGRAQLFICFHRTFAPFTQKIREQLANRRAPAMIHYRMNLGKIEHSRLLNSGHQGKVVTRASHILDVFCALLDSKPVSVSVDSLAPKDNLVFPTENFSAQITFADGSICHLLLTAMGHSDSGKERMEIFYDNKSIVMDDYERLTGYGLSQTFDEVVRTPDQGHEAMLRTYFGGLLKQSNTHADYCDRWHTVRALTWAIDQLVISGGGEREL